MRGRVWPCAAPAEASGPPRPVERHVGKGVFGLASPASSAAPGRLASLQALLPLLPFPAAAGHPRGVDPREPRLAAHEPQTWQSPSHRPRLARSTKGSTPASWTVAGVLVGVGGLPGLGLEKRACAWEVVVWASPWKAQGILSGPEPRWDPEMMKTTKSFGVSRTEKKEQALFGSFALPCVPGTDLGVFALHVAVGDKSRSLHFTSEETEA